MISLWQRATALSSSVSPISNAPGLLRAPTDEVYHIVPATRGGTHEDSNLMSLCRSCHNKIHHEKAIGAPQGAGLGFYEGSPRER